MTYFSLLCLSLSLSLSLSLFSLSLSLSLSLPPLSSHAGGDPAVTYQLLQDLRVYTVVRQVTVAATLQQPPPRVFDLFDFLIVLDHGRVVFQGPRADAVAHFSRLG